MGLERSAPPNAALSFHYSPHWAPACLTIPSEADRGGSREPRAVGHCQAPKPRSSSYRRGSPRWAPPRGIKRPRVLAFWLPAPGVRGRPGEIGFVPYSPAVVDVSSQGAASGEDRSTAAPKKPRSNRGFSFQPRTNRKLEEASKYTPRGERRGANPRASRQGAKLNLPAPELFIAAQEDSRIWVRSAGGAAAVPNGNGGSQKRQTGHLFGPKHTGVRARRAFHSSSSFALDPLTRLGDPVASPIPTARSQRPRGRHENRRPRCPRFRRRGKQARRDFPRWYMLPRAPRPPSGCSCRHFVCGLIHPHRKQSL